MAIDIPIPRPSKLDNLKNPLKTYQEVKKLKEVLDGIAGELAASTHTIQSDNGKAPDLFQMLKVIITNKEKKKNLLSIYLDLAEFIDHATYKLSISEDDIKAAEALRKNLAEGLENFFTAAAQGNG